MKRTLRHKTLFTTASLAAAFTLAPLARAQADKAESKGVERPMVQQHVAEQNASGAASAISIASDEAKHVKDHTAKKLAGHKVRGSDGKDLGSIKDFLVDAHAGSVNYAIISSGGVAGMGDKLRLVPFSALKESTEKKDSFALNCDKATFEQVPVVKEDEFKDGRYTISSSQREQLAKLDANASASVSVDVSSYLVRASDIAGKELHSGAADIGKIEAVVIDTDACTATALFDPKNDFTAKKQKYLVPLPKLQMAAAKHDPITTTLTRAEFEQVSTSSSSVSATTSTDRTQSVAASTTSAPPPVSAPATASTTTDTKADQKNATASTNSTTANADTVASATRSVSRSAIPPQDKTAQRTTEAQKTGVASTDATQDIAVATGEKKAESSASAEQKELSPTGRTSNDSDKSVAANTESTEKKSDESSASKSTTASTASTDASKSVAQASDQSKKDESKDASATASIKSDNDKSVAANTESSAKDSSAKSTESKATTTDMVGADASKGVAQASDSSNKDQAKATTSTRDDQLSSSQASSSAVAANDSATTAGASVNSADAQKKSTDVGSTDQSSTKAAGNVAANSATARSATTNDKELSPTGKSGAEQTPSANSDLVATAQSIRKALDDDATLAHLDVQVTPENDTIVLRGNVTDQRLANAIEKRAHEKGGGTKIDNQIRVQRK